MTNGQLLLLGVASASFFLSGLYLGMWYVVEKFKDAQAAHR